MAIRNDSIKLPANWSLLEWRHCILSTYGSWLYGDSRGYRTRHHREHVEGDYRSPPPAGKYDDKQRRSRDLLKQPTVQLPTHMRSIVGNALVERLSDLEAFVLCMAVGAKHVHILAKVPKSTIRFMLGKAKQHAWFVARDNGWQGRLWAKRGKAKRVSNRQHHANVYRYILDHVEQGAWIWVHPSVRRKSQ